MDAQLQRLAAAGELIAYFGYGSLVNRATHRTQIVHAVPARLAGWRRMWRMRPDLQGLDHALLTVQRDEDAAVDGLLVFDRAAHLPALDDREAGYDRRIADLGRLTAGAPVPAGVTVYVYEAGPPAAGHDGVARPILQSYLDAVLQGFHREHGNEGVERFVHETEAFDIPVLRDRHQPRYPRHVRLEDDQRDYFDRLLARRGVRYHD